MSSKIVKTILSSDQKLKVEIYQRADGTFGFDAWKFSDDELEKCWIPDGRYSYGIFQTEEEALREAEGRVAWLAQKAKY